jgi:hypothetical protein
MSSALTWYDLRPARPRRRPPRRPGQTARHPQRARGARRSAPHDTAVALAAAPTLVDLQCMEASEVDRAAACTYGRGGIGLGWSVGRDRERQNACQAAASQARTALIVL